jgi:hypothetical protein
MLEQKGEQSPYFSEGKKGRGQLGSVAQACNLSYSGGKDKENSSLRLAWTKS